MIQERLQDRTQGRWKELLPLVGIETRFLSGRHGPCPLCGGRDRFRFDDKESRGTWFCSHCGAGTGVDLVMKLKGLSFIQAKEEIERHIGKTHVSTPRAQKSETQRDADRREQMAALWGRARPLNGADLASRYLTARGIKGGSWPISVRFIDDLPYWDDDSKTRTLLPSMLAKFAAPDGKSAILHRTYLEEPGCKAAVEKPRMIMPGRVPRGGAVRLGEPAETMGIAEGIETALSAAAIFGVPVWSALSSGGLVKWQPPEKAKCILIFGDNDKSFAGQNAAYALGYRLATEGYQVEVRIPDESGTDWNDELCSRMAAV